jgi:glycosyltransferase involved in cell wall biosynthesis
MAVLAVVTSSPPAVEGGHLVIARSLVTAALEAGHDARLVLTPECQFGRQPSAYIETWRTDVHHAAGRPVDQVISLRYPSYAVRHPRHVCWLNHTMREYYDLWPRFSSGLSARARAKETVKRRIIRRVDRWLLTRNVTKVIAQSHTIQRRLRDDFRLATDVVLPPPPPRAYRCDEYGDYIFAISRLTPLKRLDLLIRALAQPSARGIQAVVAGDGESRPLLEALARALGVGDRVRFVGRVSDEELIEYYARCRAVCFAPFGEDYGFVTVEAFASRKAVVTCRDSGGPADLVRDGETGLICEPTDEALASGLARLAHDAAFAERLGAAGAVGVGALTWRGALDRLMLD